MSTALMTANALQFPAVSAADIEKALTIGDISKMPAEVRIRYYLAACESAGLNPLTRPFTPMKAQDGQVILYANKEAAEQLRKRDRVSIRVLERTKEDGLYIITVAASLPDGRVEESQGIVEIAKLQGQALANAMMKAETKAKRRATLAICGLGFPLADEADAKAVEVNWQTGEMRQALPQPVPRMETVSLEEYDGEHPLVEKINTLLDSQGLSEAQQTTWWKKMDAKYAGRSPYTLTMLYEQLQERIAQKKTAQTSAHDVITAQDDPQAGGESAAPGPSWGHPEGDLWEQEAAADAHGAGQ